MKTIMKNIGFEERDIQLMEEARKVYSLSMASFIRFCIMSKLQELNLKNNSS